MEPDTGLLGYLSSESVLFGSSSTGSFMMMGVRGRGRNGGRGRGDGSGRVGSRGVAVGVGDGRGSRGSLGSGISECLLTRHDTGKRIPEPGHGRVAIAQVDPWRH